MNSKIENEKKVNTDDYFLLAARSWKRQPEDYTDINDSAPLKKYFDKYADAEFSFQNGGTYVFPKLKRKDIKILGKEAMGMFLVGADSFREGKYITQHEQLMCKKLAYVLCGGNLSSPTTVSEKYLLDLEREAFLSLCGEAKTLDRIKYMLEKGKPLRN